MTRQRKRERGIGHELYLSIDNRTLLGVELNFIQNMVNDMNQLNELCKNFRKECDITQQQMSELTGVNIKTISAFELGRSTNINHVNKYIQLSVLQGKQVAFIQRLTDTTLDIMEVYQ